MNHSTFNTFIILALALATLASCGGGGAATVAVPTGPVSSTLPFPLQSADKALTISGFSKAFAMTASTTDTTLPQPITIICNGTGTDSTTAPTTAVNFEAKSAVSSTNSITMAFAPCLLTATLPAATLAAITQKLTAWSISSISTLYFDLNYVALGSSTTGQYGVFLTPPTLPASVQVGATGIYGIEMLYTDSTKATPNGKADMTYVIEPDTASTAMVNVTTKVYDAAGKLLQTQQSRTRITATGVSTPISIDILDTAVPPVHIVVTYN